MALGVVLTPYGKVSGGYPPAAIAYSMGRGTKFQCQYGECDPQHWTHGERGYYYDTPLGAPKLGLLARWRMKRALRGLGNIPTDFDLAKVRGYLPVESGWVTTAQGYQTGPWLPPHGVNPRNPNNIVQPLNGLRDVVDPNEHPASVNDVIATMAAQNDRAFALALVSTTAVAVSALLTVFRTIRLIHDDK